MVEVAVDVNEGFDLYDGSVVVVAVADDVDFDVADDNDDTTCTSST